MREGVLGNIRNSVNRQAPLGQDNETEYSYRTEEIETICVNGDTIYHSSVYNTEAAKDGKVFHQTHTESSSKGKK